jgi:hypothetical protein
MNTGSNYYSKVFFVMVTPEYKGLPSVYSRKLPEGSIVKCVTKPYGYFGEMAVPLDYIESIQGKDWRTIRVGVAADDYEDGKNNRYWWLPNWSDRENNYVGSGMFWREQ